MSAWGIGIGSAAAAPRIEVLLERVSVLEESAVQLHQSYAAWLRATGRFDARTEDGLYAQLCIFRNSCRTLATRLRAKEAPQLCWRQMEDIAEGLDLLKNYREYTTLDASLRERMQKAWALAGSFQGIYQSWVALEPKVVELAAMPRPRVNPPRVGPLRLLPNRYDIMSFLENRWAAAR